MPSESLGWTRALSVFRLHGGSWCADKLRATDLEPQDSKRGPGVSSLSITGSSSECRLAAPATEPCCGGTCVSSGSLGDSHVHHSWGSSRGLGWSRAKAAVPHIRVTWDLKKSPLSRQHPGDFRPGCGWSERPSDGSQVQGWESCRGLSCGRGAGEDSV